MSVRQEMDEAAKRGEDVSRVGVPETVRQTVTVPESTDPRLWCLKTFAGEQANPMPRGVVVWGLWTSHWLK